MMTRTVLNMMMMITHYDDCNDDLYKDDDNDYDDYDDD